MSLTSSYIARPPHSRSAIARQFRNSTPPPSPTCFAPRSPRFRSSRRLTRRPGRPASGRAARRDGAMPARPDGGDARRPHRLRTPRRHGVLPSRRPARHRRTRRSVSRARRSHSPIWRCARCGTPQVPGGAARLSGRGITAGRPPNRLSQTNLPSRSRRPIPPPSSRPHSQRHHTPRSSIMRLPGTVLHRRCSPPDDTGDRSEGLANRRGPSTAECTMPWFCQ